MRRVEPRRRAARRSRREMFATATSAGGQRLAERIGEPQLELDAVRRARSRRVASIAAGSWSTAMHRREAEPRRRDREHAGAAADVEQAPPLELVEQLEAEPRRRVAAGAERAAGIDRRPRSTPSGGSSHGGPIQSVPTRTGRWKSRQRSSQSGGDVVGPHLAEGGPEPLLARVVGVGDQLERRRRARSPRSPAGRARASARAPARRARAGRTRRRGGARSAERALQLLEEPLVGLVRLVGRRSLELLEQAALLVGQPPRHLRR